MLRKIHLRGSATEAQFGSKGVIQNYPELQKWSKSVLKSDLKTDPKVVSESNSKVIEKWPQKWLKSELKSDLRSELKVTSKGSRNQAFWAVSKKSK